MEKLSHVVVSVFCSTRPGVQINNTSIININIDVNTNSIDNYHSLTFNNIIIMILLLLLLLLIIIIIIIIIITIIIRLASTSSTREIAASRATLACSLPRTSSR